MDVEDNQEVPHEWIVAMVICCTFGFIIEVLILIDMIYRFCYNEQDKQIDKRIKYTTFGMVICNAIYCLLFAFFKADAIFPITDNKDACMVTSVLAYVVWGFGKSFMLILFIYKLEITFGESSLKYPPLLLALFRYFVILLSFAFVIIWFIFIRDVIGVKSTDGGWELCNVFIDKIPETEVTIIVFVICDVFLSFTTVYLFVHKLREIMLLREQMEDGIEHTSTVDTKQLEGIMAKHTLLVIIIALSTIIILGLSSVSLHVTYLLPINSVVTTICVYFMFRFTHRLFIYLCCCNQCRFCSIHCGNQCGIIRKLQRRQKQRAIKETQLTISVLKDDPHRNNMHVLPDGHDKQKQAKRRRHKSKSKKKTHTSKSKSKSKNKNKNKNKNASKDFCKHKGSKSKNKNEGKKNRRGGYENERRKKKTETKRTMEVVTNSTLSQSAPPPPAHDKNKKKIKSKMENKNTRVGTPPSQTTTPTIHRNNSTNSSKSMTITRVLSNKIGSEDIAAQIVGSHPPPLPLGTNSGTNTGTTTANDSHTSLGSRAGPNIGTQNIATQNIASPISRVSPYAGRSSGIPPPPKTPPPPLNHTKNKNKSQSQSKSKTPESRVHSYGASPTSPGIHTITVTRYSNNGHNMNRQTSQGGVNGNININGNHSNDNTTSSSNRSSLSIYTSDDQDDDDANMDNPNYRQETPPVPKGNYGDRRHRNRFESLFESILYFSNHDMSAQIMSNQYGPTLTIQRGKNNNHNRNNYNHSNYNDNNTNTTSNYQRGQPQLNTVFTTSVIHEDREDKASNL